MPSITLILHNIRSTHNVGSIFRTAEGMGVQHIVLSGYTPYPRLKTNETRLPHIVDKLTSQIHKTALGAEELVTFSYYSHLDDWLDYNAQADRLPIIALEQSPNSRVINGYQPPEAFALLLGEEVNGIDKQFLEICDETIEITMKGKKESYNVSVACGIALYALTTT